MKQDSFFKLTFRLPLPSFNQGTHKLEINPCKALLISATHTTLSSLQMHGAMANRKNAHLSKKGFQSLSGWHLLNLTFIFRTLALPQNSRWLIL